MRTFSSYIPLKGRRGLFSRAPDNRRPDLASIASRGQSVPEKVATKPPFIVPCTLNTPPTVSAFVLVFDAS